MVFRRETLVMVFRSAAPVSRVLAVSLLSGFLGWIFLVAMAVFLSCPTTPEGPTPLCSRRRPPDCFLAHTTSDFPSGHHEFGSAPGGKARWRVAGGSPRAQDRPGAAHQSPSECLGVAGTGR